MKRGSLVLAWVLLAVMVVPVGAQFGWTIVNGVARWGGSMELAGSSLTVGVGTNPFIASTDDAKTSLSAEAVSVVDDGTLFMGAAVTGYVMLSGSDGAVCLWSVSGSTNTTAGISGGSCGTAAASDTVYDLYYDAVGGSGAGYYFMNRRGGTRLVRLTLIGA